MSAPAGLVTPRRTPRGLCLAITMRLFHIDHLLPGDAPSIADAGVAISDDGTIADVGRAADVLPRHGGPAVERVRGVVFPGLVNAHTHLELSGLHRKVVGGRGFVAWIESLLAVRSEHAPEDDAEAIDAAVADLEKFGTVAVGEVTNTLAAVGALARRGIGGWVFHEVFGQERDAVLRRVHGLRAELEERHAAWPTRDLAYAPAAHTLYTTHPDAVRTVVDGALRHDQRTSIHLAEHQGERQAIERGEGPIAAWFERRTRHKPEWPRMPLFDYAEALGVLRPGVLLVHLTDARPEELSRVAESGASVVLCPRSNAFIEARMPPLLDLLAAGIAPALGTDSLASNTSLDVLAEAGALHERFPAVPAWHLIRMATHDGARALGRADLGRVARGTRPGLYAIDAIDGEVTHEPAAFVLDSLTAPRRRIASRGPEPRA